ncbi:hypothetical protein WJX79_005520 [Trebouxia sp. C0005]
MSRVLPTRLSAPQLTTKCAALVICILSAARLRAVVLTGCFRVQHPVCMSRSCGSRRQLQNVRPLLQQDRLGDAAEIAFLRKRLEQLGEEKLILLRAQATGIPGAIASVDNSAGITQALLAPFPEIAFQRRT